MIQRFAPAVLVLFVCGCRGQVAAVSQPAEVRPIAEKTSVAEAWNPEFLDLQGHAQRPFDDAAVKALALIFILQDCPIANSYMPEINRLADAYSSRGIRFLLIHVDPKLSGEDALRHAQEYQVRIPVALDAKHIWVKQAGATRTPEVAVFSRAGQVLYRGRIDDQYVGVGKKRTEVTSHDLADALDAILAGRPVPHPTTQATGCYIPDLPHGE